MFVFYARNLKLAHEEQNIVKCSLMGSRQARAYYMLGCLGCSTRAMGVLHKHTIIKTSNQTKRNIPIMNI
jgi:hypothetical protein